MATCAPAGKMASAMVGLNPKINIWTQGEGAGASDAMAPLRNLFTALPPMLVSQRASLQVCDVNCAHASCLSTRLTPGQCTESSDQPEPLRALTWACM